MLTIQNAQQTVNCQSMPRNWVVQSHSRQKNCVIAGFGELRKCWAGSPVRVKQLVCLCELPASGQRQDDVRYGVWTPVVGTVGSPLDSGSQNNTFWADHFLNPPSEWFETSLITEVSLSVPRRAPGPLKDRTAKPTHLAEQVGRAVVSGDSSAAMKKFKVDEKENGLKLKPVKPSRMLPVLYHIEAL